MLRPPDPPLTEGGPLLRPFQSDDLEALVAACQDPEIPRWALREADVERLELLTHPANIPSQRVAERAGFVREGVLRRYLEIKGERRDCVMYSLLAADLESL